MSTYVCTLLIFNLQHQTVCRNTTFFNDVEQPFYVGLAHTLFRIYKDNQLVIHYEINIFLCLSFSITVF